MLKISDIEVVTDLTDVKMLQVVGGDNCMAKVLGFPEALRDELLNNADAYNDFCPQPAPVESVGGYTGPGNNIYGGTRGRLRYR